MYLKNNRNLIFTMFHSRILQNERSCQTASLMTAEEVQEVLNGKVGDSNTEESDSDYSSEGSDYAEDYRPLMKMVQLTTADIMWN